MDVTRETILKLKVRSTQQETIERIRKNKEAKSVVVSPSCDLETFSGLVLRCFSHRENRLLPQEELSSMLKQRRFIPIGTVMKEVRPETVIDQDWVTIGVLVKKSEPKQAKNQSKFVSWVLSDLEGTELTVLLFNTAYEQWWKEGLGAVLAMLNSTLLSGGKAFSIDVNTKIVKIGEAKTYSICVGITGSEKCGNYVNSKYSTLCSKHSARPRPHYRPELISPSIIPASAYPRPKTTESVEKKPLKPTQKERSALERYLESRNQLAQDSSADFVLLDVATEAIPETLKRKSDFEGQNPGGKRPKLTETEASPETFSDLNG